MNIKKIISEIIGNKKKLIGTCCGLILILAIISTIVSPPTTTTTDINIAEDENLFNNSIGIKTSQWDYAPEGFPLIGDDVYGSCEGVDSDGVEHTYFFSDPQMAALGNISDYTFEFNNLHVIAEKNDQGNYIVEHIFYKNGSEVSYDWDSYDFKAYAKIAGANNPNCVSGFGYGTDEVNNVE